MKLWLCLVFAVVAACGKPSWQVDNTARRPRANGAWLVPMPGSWTFKYLIDPNTRTCAITAPGYGFLAVDCAVLAANVPEARAYITWLAPPAPPAPPGATPVPTDIAPRPAESTPAP